MGIINITFALRTVLSKDVKAKSEDEDKISNKLEWFINIYNKH